MDPRDDLDSLAGGVECAACGDHVPTDRIRILATRDDILFVEIDCPSCRTEALGIVIASEEDPDDEADADIDVLDRILPAPIALGEFGPGDAERFATARPIGSGDVDTVREILARGGLAELIGWSEPPAAGPAA
jgi:hypothetical protein